MDNTFDYFLQTYGKEKCFEEFEAGIEELSQRENKVRHATFVTDYIKILGLGNDDMNLDEASDRAPPPPNRPTKKGP